MSVLLTTIMALSPVLPVQTHTTAEIEDWLTDWRAAIRAEEGSRVGGASDLQLGLELRDFAHRHTWYFYPSSAPSSPSRFRGMGSDVERWRGLVAAYFPGEVDLALCIMAGESGGNPNAQNPSGAAGLFQIMPFWWNKYGGDRFDPESNVAMARLIRDAQGWSAWNVYPSC